MLDKGPKNKYQLCLHEEQAYLSEGGHLAPPCIYGSPQRRSAQGGTSESISININIV